MNSENELVGVTRMARDLAAASATLSSREARFLVDAYYIHQRNRIRAAHQVSALEKFGEPSMVLGYLTSQETVLEQQIKRALDRYTKGQQIGRWMQSITGLGPVITAGFLAHIDMDVATYASKIWRFAGLDPKVKWLGKAKGDALFKQLVPSGAANPDQLAQIAQHVGFNVTNFVNRCQNLSRTEQMAQTARRPWNGRLKSLCWKLGQSIVKTQNSKHSFYGPLFRERRAYEVHLNEAGELKEQARLYAPKFVGTQSYDWYSGCYYPMQDGIETIVSEEKVGSKTAEVERVSAGPQHIIGKEVILIKGTGRKYIKMERGQGIEMLPPGHLMARATRHTVKLFLSHLHYRWTESRGGKAPLPYVFVFIPGHTDWVEPKPLDEFITPPEWAEDELKKLGFTESADLDSDDPESDDDEE